MRSNDQVSMLASSWQLLEPTLRQQHGHGHAPRHHEHEETEMTRQRRNDLHKLDVYRCALEPYRAVGRIVAGFPRGEADFRSQMRRASRSVPFHIGEGVGKRGRARAAA
ncbi:MAG TPA: four helix bundle protein, partial [Polyangiaceae bacterium]|nr:four helix bundle protein [Polyangiaceae bacterium]